MGNGSVSRPPAVVVGGGSGIGAAVAQHRRGAGRTVVVLDIDGERDIDCDVGEPDRVEAALDEVGRRHGLADEITVTAGIGHSSMLLDSSPDDWDRVMNVNARGAWLVLRSMARRWIAGGRPGSAVVLSSVSSRLPDRSMGLYCASKAALNMVVAVAAVEWGPYDIRVNAVAPGVTNTPMLRGAPVDGRWLAGVQDRTPAGRLGTADDIAEAVTALHGLRWVTGQVLECDGGLGLWSPIDPLGLPVPRPVRGPG